MEYRRIGNSGLKVSSIGIGCNNFGGRMDQSATLSVVNAAIEAGITLFDTADVYGGTQSEVQLGNALGERRQDVVIATKFGMTIGDSSLAGGGSRRYIMKAAEDSLRRLNTDYIDLYQIHFPDSGTPIEETLDAMDDLVRSGKVRYIGCSNFAGWQIAEAELKAQIRGVQRFVSAQNNFSLLERRVEAEVLPACRHFGLGMLPYFPLASGLLTGKYRRGESAPEGTRLAGPRGQRALTDASFDRLDALAGFAEERDKALIDLAFGWLLSHNVVCSVIAGATRPDQVNGNVAAGEWRLSEDDMKAIREIL